MGRSFMPKFRIELKVINRGAPLIETYHTKHCGKPTAENIKGYLKVFNDSLLPGGVNSHIGPKCTVYGGKVINQMTGQPVAEFEDLSIVDAIKSRPMFQVL